MKTTCNNCKHLIKNSMSCEAFPNGIPCEILMSQIPHDKKLKNQKNDIVFELIEPNQKDLISK